MTTRLDVANKARELEGVKFRKYGRDVKYGLDCVGVPLWVGQRLGLLPRIEVPAYTFPPDPSLFDELLPQFLDEVQEINIGSLLVLLSDKGKPFHMCLVVPALYTGNHHCIGAIITPSRAFIGEYKLDARVRKALYKVYDYRGLET